MGVTIESIHVYSEKEISYPNVEFSSFSKGWYTVTSSIEEPSYSLARKISKSTRATVLWFSTFDSEGISLRFLQAGKIVAQHSDLYQQSKRISQIPALIGYENGEKRRISQIFACGDFDLKIVLLEEFFGVCLLPFADLYEENPNAMKRTRGNEQYLAFQAEEKKLRGKNAPIKASLVFETCGKIFYQLFGQSHGFYKSGFYYFGYDTEESNYSDGNLRPVHFSGGRLLPVTEEDLTTGLISTQTNDERYTIEFFPKTRVSFTEKAPEQFAQKTLVMPSGFYPFDFDGKGRLFLSNEHGGMAVMDSNNKVISRFSLKGVPCSMDGEFILTTDSESFFAYYYNPNQHIRIYRIDDLNGRALKSTD